VGFSSLNHLSIAILMQSTGVPLHDQTGKFSMLFCSFMVIGRAAEKAQEEYERIQALKNGTARSYTNNKLTQEMVFENSTAILLREYHDNGNLATELPANGEAKIYYENGKVKESVLVKNGKREGIAREYDETGKVIKETLYRNDKEMKKAKKVK